MDGEAFREQVTDEMATELDRLGSEKLLIALTDADLEEETVLEAAATSEHAARTTFEQWAESADDEQAREVFADVAEQETDHYERVAAHLPDGFEPADGGPLHAHLRQQDDSIARAAGLVGRGLVSDRTHLQVISFFVNEGDTELSDLFRDLRSETADSLEAGLDLLDAFCEEDADWEAAAGVAEYTIQIAYDDYADALAGMGMDPKPIC
ncbi:ferritin family protein [Salinarchaeum laminariae]|uniref:ferritin family protein n=1 Tax=Salinarchaeum laminariae TaxID=869888 RepID=UPI0020BD5182|nr:ferritin family protein [Salinarchaeum laminariae]